MRVSGESRQFITLQTKSCLQYRLFTCVYCLISAQRKITTVYCLRPLQVAADEPGHGMFLGGLNRYSLSGW